MTSSTVSFTPDSLVAAIKQLFELNNYSVQGSTQINGAEIDLIATPLGDPFGRKVYIEATVEYVDNDKYGKDIGKLAMIANIEPQSQKLIVSSKGFSGPVVERAKFTDIWTLSYDDLFRRFQKFDPYISKFTSSENSAVLTSLVQVYEEPRFEDSIGNEVATAYLTEWKNSPNVERPWIVVTGEYGTGKTALTQVLLYRWLTDYKLDPSLPIPFRIELRNFSRQFDARGLLHHFLDTNGLGHIPIDFAERLVRSGRVIMLLDGYDEMAQYFNARERRQCLEALASLSAEGARGILTSRPNYFTQSEELQVFEILYTSVKSNAYLSASAAQYLENEKHIDSLLARFLNQFERHLKDLTPEQTQNLVKRILKDDPPGLIVVLSLLSRVFRQDGEGAKSLSGKPVIVAYLLEVVEQLKVPGYKDTSHGDLTEWQVYKVIVDQLMMRDFKRSPEVMPDLRRTFLQRLAIFLSKRSQDTIQEDEFRDLVNTSFKREIARHIGEARNEAASRFFSDMRSSATLTRSVTASGEGWRFSHNSLREYLVAEELVNSLQSGEISSERIRISDAMRTFAASIDDIRLQKLAGALRQAWPQPAISGRAKGQMLELLWDGLHKIAKSEIDPNRSLLQTVVSDLKNLSGIEIHRLTFSDEDNISNLRGLSFKDTSLSDTKFRYADMCEVEFTNAVLDNVDFTGASLNAARFHSTTIFDVNFSEANIQGTEFLNIDVDALTIFGSDAALGNLTRLEGKFALGYLRYCGAVTDDLSDYFVIYHHPDFPVALKIVENLSKQKIHQRRGLEQRGAAQTNVPFARSFIEFLLTRLMVEIPKGRKDLLETTELGREVFQKFLVGNIIDERLRPFFQ